MSDSVVSVASPGELLAAVPHLLGFVPRHSLVVVGLRPPRGRVRLTARVDLPAPGDEADVIRAVLPPLLQGRCTEVVAVVYLDDTSLPPTGDLPGDQLVTRLAQSLSHQGVALRDAVCASGGRFRSYLCHDATCCAPHGAPIPSLEGSVLAPHTVLRGRRVWASRDELADSLRHAPVSELTLTRAALDAAVDRLVARLGDGASAVRLRQEILRTWQRSVARAASGQPVDDHAVGDLLVGLSDVAVRDAVIVGSFDDDPARALPLLERLTRCAPHPYIASTAVLLAWHAYAAGDGALASVAIDRALTADPAHSLARLVEQGLAQGLPPEMLREIARSSRAQVSARLTDPPTGRASA